MELYVGDLITAQRGDTRNKDTTAIVDSEFVNYNNYAQNMLYGIISRSYASIFTFSEDFAVTAGDDTYSVTDNIAFGTRIVMVEYSYDGQEKNFTRIKPTPNIYQRLTYPGRPKFYRRIHGAVKIEPAPEVTEGTLRIWYERGLDRLQIRQARVNGTPSSTDIDLTHSGFGAPSTDVEALFISGTKICICNSDGTPMLYNGVISSYNAGSDVLTLAANVSTYLVTGYSLANLADGYLTIGRYTSTHSKLCNEAEQYFIEFVNRCIKNRDASKQVAYTDKILQECAAMVVGGYKVPDKDLKSFPVHDWSMMIPGYE